MAAVESELPESEEQRVIGWREEALLRAGYDGMAAIELALRPDVDLHVAIGLVRRGCPPATALHILL